MVSHKFLWRNTGIPSLSGIFFAKIPRLFVEILDFHRHLGSRRFAFCLGGIRAPAGLHAKKLLDGCQCLFAGQGRVDGATDEECAMLAYLYTIFVVALIAVKILQAVSENPEPSVNPSS